MVSRFPDCLCPLKLFFDVCTFDEIAASLSLYRLPLTWKDLEPAADWFKVTPPPAHRDVSTPGLLPWRGSGSGNEKLLSPVSFQRGCGCNLLTLPRTSPKATVFHISVLTWCFCGKTRTGTSYLLKCPNWHPKFRKRNRKLSRSSIQADEIVCGWQLLWLNSGLAIMLVGAEMLELRKFHSMIVRFLLTRKISCFWKMHFGR